MTSEQLQFAINAVSQAGVADLSQVKLKGETLVALHDELTNELNPTGDEENGED